MHYEVHDIWVNSSQRTIHVLCRDPYGAQREICFSVEQVREMVRGITP